MNPQYTDEYLDEWYSRYIDVAQIVTDPVRGGLRSAHKAETLALVERYMAPARFLSLGCGDGLELELAAERGWRAEGWDVDPQTTRRVEQRTGMTVRSGDLRRAGFEEGAYSCVFLDQVLEHPKAPGELLRMCRAWLRPGGVLYVGVPNIGSISARWQTLAGRLHLKRRRGRHYDTWHHLFLQHAPRAGPPADAALWLRGARPRGRSQTGRRSDGRVEPRPPAPLPAARLFLPHPGACAGLSGGLSGGAQLARGLAQSWIDMCRSVSITSAASARPQASQRVRSSVGVKAACRLARNSSRW
jgi:SAM-dependent methyltransferase